MNPYNAKAWSNLGIGLNRVNATFSKISNAYLNSLRLDPANTAAMMNFAGPLVQQKRYSEATALVVKAMNLAPEKAQVLNNADLLLRELNKAGQQALAMRLLLGWTAAWSTDVDAWHNLGLLYLNERNLDQSILCFERVRQLSPQDEFAVGQLKKLYSQKGGNYVR